MWWKKIFQSFALALENIRANFFHTVLSVLGIVIGVGALVAILSFIDGMEKYARDQIAETTSLKTVILSTEAFKTVDGIRIRKDTVNALGYDPFNQLLGELGPLGRYNLVYEQPSEIRVAGKPLGAMLQGLATAHWPDSALLHGIRFSDAAVAGRDSVALINELLARQITGHDENLASALGQTLQVKHQSLRIVGVVRDPRSEAPQAYLPITLFSGQALQERPPTAYFEAQNVENVKALKERMEGWLKGRYGEQQTDFKVITNDFRVDQATNAFVLFRVIMGLIVGISVLVGGIGVMNVLLISVTERTAEIGLRKAVGAKKRDILHLFLAESITVSAFGSLLGLALGVLATMIIIPIIRAFTKLPFQAIYTWNTFLVIAVVAVLVGIVFGTYPALKAARMDPVEAIRVE